jgi:zinc transport system permease protein
LTPGTNVDLLNFLFGNILWINTQDLILLALLDFLILILIGIYYRRFLSICFDEQQATLRNIPVRKLYLLLLALIALSIVLLIQVIGTVLVIALLSLPATIASLFTGKFFYMMALATCLSALLSILGLGSSYLLDWPPGATIALLAATTYLITLCYKKKFINPFTNTR